MIPVFSPRLHQYIMDIATCDHDFAHFNTYISGMTHLKVFPLPATWLQDTGDISRNRQVTLDGRLQETHWKTVGNSPHPSASGCILKAPRCSQFGVQPRYGKLKCLFHQCSPVQPPKIGAQRYGKNKRDMRADKCKPQGWSGEVLAWQGLGHNYVRDNTSASWIRSCDMRYIQAHSLDTEWIRTTGFLQNQCTLQYSHARHNSHFTHLTSIQIISNNSDV